MEIALVGPPSSPSNLTVSEVERALVLRWHNDYTPDYLVAAPDTHLRLRYLVAVCATIFVLFLLRVLYSPPFISTGDAWEMHGLDTTFCLPLPNY